MNTSKKISFRSIPLTTKEEVKQSLLQYRYIHLDYPMGIGIYQKVSEITPLFEGKVGILSSPILVFQWKKKMLHEDVFTYLDVAKGRINASDYHLLIIEERYHPMNATNILEFAKDIPYVLDIS